MCILNIKYDNYYSYNLFISCIIRTGGFYTPRPEKDAKAYLKLNIMCLGYHWNSEERISLILQI